MNINDPESRRWDILQWVGVVQNLSFHHPVFTSQNWEQDANYNKNRDVIDSMLGNGDVLTLQSSITSLRYQPEMDI